MKYQSGMSLIEVMVAVLILAVGLLGLASLQARTLVWNDSSHYRSIAADLAADLADRIRANRSPIVMFDEFGSRPVAPGGGVVVPATPNFSTCMQSGANVTGCPAVFRVQADMAEWNTNLRTLLPNGTFAFDLNPGGVTAVPQGFRYTVVITWLDDRGAGTTESYVAVVE